MSVTPAAPLAESTGRTEKILLLIVGAAMPTPAAQLFASVVPSVPSDLPLVPRYAAAKTDYPA